MKSEPRDSLVNLLLPFPLILGLVMLLGFNSGQHNQTIGIVNPLEEWLKVTVSYLAVAAEIVAAIVIGEAIVRSSLSYIIQLFSRHHFNSTQVIRLQLGRVLALGLEFTVASDILRTAVSPTRQDILNLGAIVLLRTLLNYFLEREIRQGEHPRFSKTPIGLEQ
jgi:uncharacterized membrane protein